MFFGFLYPWLFLASVGGLILLLLYLWQRKAGRRRISALFLWPAPEVSQRSGSRWLLRRLPLPFYLELLALLCLVAAGSGPFFWPRATYPPLVIVLDNSYSMQACRPGELSAQQKASRHLQKLLAKQSGRRIIWILAGNKPQLLADSREPVDFQNFWTATDSSDCLAEGLALGREHCPQGEFLLYSDHGPSFPLETNTGWFADAEPLPNLALVNARRQEKQLLLEVANYSPSSRDLQLEIQPQATRAQLTLAAGERRKIVYSLPATASKHPLKISISAGGDALDSDNSLTLLNEDRPALTYTIAADLPDNCQRELLTVLTDNPQFQNSNNPELYFGPPALALRAAHRFVWHLPTQAAAVNSQALSGHPDHPLLRGLPLADLRWLCSTEISIPGEILLWQSNIPLFSVVKRWDGYYDFHLHLQPTGSNISRQPFWPILFWNLAEFLQQSRPGPSRSNWRDHELTSINLPPGKVKPLLAVRNDKLSIPGTSSLATGYFAHLPPGLYQVTYGEHSWPISVSALSERESDLGSASAYFCAAQIPTAAGSAVQRSCFWLPTLLALCLLVWQQLYLVRRRDSR